MEAGIVEDEQGYLTKCACDIRDILPEILCQIPAKSIQNALNCSRTYSYMLRRGDRKPSKKLLPKVIRLAADFARKKLAEGNEPNIQLLDDELAILRVRNYLRKSGSQ